MKKFIVMCLICINILAFTMPAFASTKSRAMLINEFASTYRMREDMNAYYDGNTNILYIYVYGKTASYYKNILQKYKGASPTLEKAMSEMATLAMEIKNQYESYPKIIGLQEVYLIYTDSQKISHPDLLKNNGWIAYSIIEKQWYIMKEGEIK